ncbi:hypothetical protein AB1Y20_002310 [Prymnesium parvum]|uniref:Uncharacterized protein n=1 Tax=Prymnesium parvum TaxID=97485 RepID=A0AB34J7M8_PRYPA
MARGGARRRAAAAGGADEPPPAPSDAAASEGSPPGSPPRSACICGQRAAECSCGLAVPEPVPFHLMPEGAQRYFAGLAACTARPPLPPSRPAGGRAGGRRWSGGRGGRKGRAEGGGGGGAAVEAGEEGGGGASGEGAAGSEAEGGAAGSAAATSDTAEVEGAAEEFSPQLLEGEVKKAEAAEGAARRPSRYGRAWERVKPLAHIESHIFHAGAMSKPNSQALLAAEVANESCRVIEARKAALKEKPDRRRTAAIIPEYTPPAPEELEEDEFLLLGASCELQVGHELMCACSRGDEKLCLELVESLGVHYADPWGRTAVIAAAAAGETRLVATLLELRASVNSCDGDERSALWWACHHDVDQTAALLLDCRADACLADVDGITPLVTAVQKGNEGAVHLLLSRAAENQLPHPLVVTDQLVQIAVCNHESDIEQALLRFQSGTWHLPPDGRRQLLKQRRAPLLDEQVELCGLEEHPEANGARGVAVDFDNATGRYEVSFPRGDRERTAYRAANLRLVGGAASCPEGTSAPTAAPAASSISASTSGSASTSAASTSAECGAPAPRPTFVYDARGYNSRQFPIWHAKPSWLCSEGGLLKVAPISKEDIASIEAQDGLQPPEPAEQVAKRGRKPGRRAAGRPPAPALRKSGRASKRRRDGGWAAT